MKQLVIIPGGFHPFHAGHAALYQSAQAAFPAADVYVAATNDTSTRPFPFAIKEKLAKLAGVAPDHFIQVKSPFRAEEIVHQFNPNDTQLIFVRSEKDANKPPQGGGTKKDGSPSYLQPLGDDTQPLSQHAYMAYLPTVEFGPGMTSATEIRGAWPNLNQKRKTALVMSLYPKTQTNPKLAVNVVKMLDTAMGVVDESALGNLPRPNKRNQFKSLHRLRKQRGLDEQGVAEGSLNEFAPGGEDGNSPYAYGMAILGYAEDYKQIHGKSSSTNDDVADILEIGNTFLNKGMAAGIAALFSVDTFVSDSIVADLAEQGFNVMADLIDKRPRSAQWHQQVAAGQQALADYEANRKKSSEETDSSKAVDTLARVLKSSLQDYQAAAGDKNKLKQLGLLIGLSDNHRTAIHHALQQIQQNDFDGAIKSLVATPPGASGPGYDALDYGYSKQKAGVSVQQLIQFIRKHFELSEQGVAEGHDDEDPFELSSDYALHIANAGRKMMTQLANMSKKIQTDSTAAQNANRWNLGDFMHQHYETDDLNAINQVFEEYGVGGFFDQNLYELLSNWSSQGPEYVTAWKQYSGDVIKNSTRQPSAQSVHEQGVAEGVETPQQQQVRAAISKGMEKWDQNGLATYQSQPAKRHYFASSDWASGQLKGINSIDPNGTVVIELNDTTTAGLVKKLAALGGMPGVKTRQLKMTFDLAKANADGVTRGDVAEASNTMQRYGQTIIKRARAARAAEQAARAAEPEPKKEEPPASSDYSSMSTRDYRTMMQQLKKPKNKNVAAAPDYMEENIKRQ